MKVRFNQGTEYGITLIPETAHEADTLDAMMARIEGHHETEYAAGILDNHAGIIPIMPPSDESFAINTLTVHVITEWKKEA